jgi:hypothetical protein
MRSERLALRLAALILIIGILGLPIDDVAAYGLLVAAALAVFTGSLTTRPARWIAAVALAAAVIAAHLWWPAPRIEEGHNAFLPGPRIAETSGLPPDVLSVMSRQFDEEYPPDRRCGDRNLGCWRPDRSGEADGFAFSADAVFDHPAYSRRVAGIGFSDPANLRLGFINDYAYGWPDNWSDIKRFERDRHSLNLFDRYRVTFPLFVMYVLPGDFAGSTLCWRGTVLWEGPDAHFETMTAAERQCRDIVPDDAGRRIFAVSIKRDVRLAMTLAPNATILFRRAIVWGLTLAGAIGIAILLVRVEPRQLALPALLIGFALVTTLFVDASFIGGFRPLDSGDDGIAYEGFGRAIVRHLLSGDVAAAIEGVEPVYYFTPGFRYARALELLVFGETFLLYLSAMLALPVLALALFRRFLPARWALVLVLGFAATPIGALFGSSLFQYVVWASRGYSDPFAAVLLVAAMVLLLPKRDTGGTPGFWPIFAAGLLFAAAAFCRPNLVLAAGTMVAGAAAIWIANRQWGRAAVLVAAFAMLALSPLHNYVFGNAFVLFSDNVNQPQTLLMSPLGYIMAVYELVRLDFAGEHVKEALAQLYRWLSGPEELTVMVPIHALAVAVLVRVGVFGARFDPWLRVIALATLLQHGIGATYVNFARYNLGTWLMTMMVTAAWLDREGLVLLCRGLPGACDAWRRNAVVRRLGTMVGAWADWLGLAEAAPGRNAAYIRPIYDSTLRQELSH